MKPIPRFNNQAFMLLEAVLAMTIIAVALMALIESNSNNHRRLQEQCENIEAINLAQEELSRIMAAGPEKKIPESATNSRFHIEVSDVIPEPETSENRIYLSGDHVREVSIKVSWNSGGRKKTFELRTLLLEQSGEITDVSS